MEIKIPDIAIRSGVKPEEYQAEMQKFPDLTPEAATGNILMRNRQPTPIVTPVTIPPAIDKPVINRPILAPESELNKAQKSYFDIINKPSKTLEQIRQEERTAVQSQIDAINEQMNQELARVRREGEARTARGTSIATSAGISASPFGETQRAEVDEYNARQRQAVEALRAEKLASIAGASNQRAIERARIEEQKSIEGAEKYLGYLQGLQTKARADLTDLAKSGLSLDEVPQETFGKIIDQSGYDTFTAKAIYNASLPEEQRQDIKYEVLNDRIVGYRFNTKTGKLDVYKSEPVPEITGGLAEGMEYNVMKTDSGQLVYTPKTFDQTKPIKDQIIIFGEEGEFGKTAIERESSLPASLQEYEYAKEQGFAKSFLDFVKEKKEREVELIGGYTPSENKEITSINDKVAKYRAYQNVMEGRFAVDNLIAGLEQDTGAGHIAAINQFQKLIDKGAVTRDQDVKLLTERGQSLMNRLQAGYSALSTGKPLSEDLVKEIRGTAQSMYDAQVKALNRDPFILTTRKNLERKNIDVNDTILGELDTFQQNVGETTSLILPDDIFSKVHEAQKEGYSSKEIVDGIALDPLGLGLKEQIAEARKGYDDDTVLKFLMGEDFNSDLDTSVKGQTPKIKKTGSVSYRHNNPLNIKFGQFAQKYGAKQG